MGRKSIERYRYKDQEIREMYVIKFMVYFQKNGIEKVSMSKMASDLGISKTTIYNHFETKEVIVRAAIDYKMGVIGEYQSVLENITLPYTERYRKAMLFFCVQTYDVSSMLLDQIQRLYPSVWKRVMVFQKGVMEDLESYYEIGIDIGAFRKDANPLLLSLDDQQFFNLLANRELLEKQKIEVLPAFNHHFQTKFNGLIDPGYRLLSEHKG